MARKDYYHVESSPKPNSIVAAASAVVISEDGKILLHKRRDNNFWSLLGGKMEPGETIHETAVREVREESGLVVEVVKLIGVYTDPHHIIEYSDGEIRQQFSICFQCKIISGSIQCSDESFEVQLFYPEEIKNLNLHPAQRIRIEDCLANNNTAFYR